MDLEVLYEKILVKPLEADKVTMGGIAIPQELQKKPSKGTVVAVGCGLKDRPMIIKVGATVIYVQGAGIEIEHEGEKYLAMQDRDCLAQY